MSDNSWKNFEIFKFSFEDSHTDIENRSIDYVVLQKTCQPL